MSVQQDESDLGRNIYSALVGKIYFKTKPPLAYFIAGLRIKASFMKKGRFDCWDVVALF